MEGDRAFKIMVGDEYKDKWLSAYAVSGLIKLNQQRKDSKADKNFLKALVIGACTLQRFKEFPKESIFEEGVFELIKGIFKSL